LLEPVAVKVALALAQLKRFPPVIVIVWHDVSEQVMLLAESFQTVIKQALYVPAIE
jgi:hypothetical protein